MDPWRTGWLGWRSSTDSTPRTGSLTPGLPDRVPVTAPGVAFAGCSGGSDPAGTEGPPGATGATAPKGPTAEVDGSSPLSPTPPTTWLGRGPTTVASRRCRVASMSRRAAGSSWCRRRRQVASRSWPSPVELAYGDGMASISRSVPSGRHVAPARLV
jgi:hypothetical protein